MYKHRVLHRDISENNVLIHPGDHTGGFLIDFDLAIRTGREGKNGAMHRTGTFDFMALDVLRPPAGYQHSPLHDLESFFYVLLWITIKYEEGGKPRNPDPHAPALFQRRRLVFSKVHSFTLRIVEMSQQGARSL